MGFYEGVKTGELLWAKLKDKEIEQIMTDHWKTYEKFVPRANISNQKSRPLQQRATIACSGISSQG
jgi:IS1 family transposase